MGIFDKVKEKMAHKDSDQATQEQNQAGQGTGQMAGGQYVDQTGQGMQTAQNVVGQQGGPQDPNQAGYQDPNQPGYQDPTQSGGLQDQNQGYQDQSYQDQGYQDPSQDQDQN